VELLVKNVYVSSEQYTFEVDQEISIKDVKKLIASNFPGTPAIADQKLIFGGKICEENDQLKKILTQNQVQTKENGKKSVVFHLLITSALPRGGISSAPSSSTSSPASSASTSVGAGITSRTRGATTNDTTLSPVATGSISAVESSGSRPPTPPPTPTLSARSHTAPSTPLFGPSAAFGVATSASAGVGSEPRSTVIPPAFAGMIPSASIPTTHGTSTSSPMHFSFGGLGITPPASPFHGSPLDTPAPTPVPGAEVGVGHGRTSIDFYAQQMLLQQQAMIIFQIQHLQRLQQYYSANPPPAGVAGHVSPPTHAPNDPHAQHHGAPGVYGHFYGGHQYMHHPFPPPGTAPHGFVPPYHDVPPIGVREVPNVAPEGSTAPRPRQQREPNVFIQFWREIIPLIDLRLALKMAFMLFVIGQDTPMDRMIILSGLSVLAYMQLTGIFAKIYDLYIRSNNRNNVPQGGAAVGAPGQGAQGRHRPGGDPIGGGDISMGVSRIANALRISTDAGFVKDLKYFMLGFLCSLVPVWRPLPPLPPPSTASVQAQAQVNPGAGEQVQPQQAAIPPMEG
jgi:hypothetical protein